MYHSEVILKLKTSLLHGVIDVNIIMNGTAVERVNTFK